MFVDRSRAHMHALASWREAERLVAERWVSFVQAGPVARQFTFGSYLAALDAEETAARKLALTADHKAAPRADRLAA